MSRCIQMVLPLGLTRTTVQAVRSLWWQMVAPSPAVGCPVGLAHGGGGYLFQPSRRAAGLDRVGGQPELLGGLLDAAAFVPVGPDLRPEVIAVAGIADLGSCRAWTCLRLAGAWAPPAFAVRLPPRRRTRRSVRRRLRFRLPERHDVRGGVAGTSPLARISGHDLADQRHRDFGDGEDQSVERSCARWTA